MAYQVPAAVFETEYLVKKSRFIARVVPISSRQDSLAAVDQARCDYPDARHHCWAYLLGKPQDASSAGMNDDGEPAGTAGKPILNVLQHGPFGDVLVIVIRYFGGIKLGAGGLVRAYGTATQQVLDAAPAQRKIEMLQYRARGDFACEQALRHWLRGAEGVLLAVEYSEQVELSLALPAAQGPRLAEFCAAHKVELTALTETYTQVSG